MNTIKHVLSKTPKTNTGLGSLDQSDLDCLEFGPSSPTIVDVFVMDKNDTKVTFRDDGEDESEDSKKNISLVLRNSEDLLDIEKFLGKELAEFYQECAEMEERIRGEGTWRLTFDLLSKLPSGGINKKLYFNVSE